MLDYFESMRYDRLERLHDDDLKTLGFDDDDEGEEEEYISMANDYWGELV